MILWEKSIQQTPKLVLNGLVSIDPNLMSKENQSQYKLIKCIAEERCNVAFVEDSAIIAAEKWYSRRKDYKNIYRSILYKGIAKYNTFKTDTLSFSLIKKAEDIYRTHKLNDPLTESIMCKYLSRMYLAQKKYDRAEKYLNRSISICHSVNDTNEIFILKIDQIRMSVTMRNFSKAFICISQFNPLSSLTPDMEVEVYNAFYIYYMAKKDYALAIAYLRKMVSLSNASGLNKLDKSSIYYMLATQYKQLGRKDSALFFINQSLLHSSDSINKRKHSYYKFLADLQESSGDYASALENYRKAYTSYIKVYSKISTNHYIEVEKRYEEKNNSIKQNAINDKFRFLFVLVILLLVIMILTIIILRRKIKSNIIEKDKLEYKYKNLITESNNKWLINEIQKVASGVLPPFINEISKEIEKCKTKNTAIADNLSDSISNVRENSKIGFLSITNSKNFISSFPEIQEFADFSSFEKLTFILLKNGYTFDEVAKLLMTTKASVRATKTKIKVKSLKNPNSHVDESPNLPVSNIDSTIE